MLYETNNRIDRYVRETDIEREVDILDDKFLTKTEKQRLKFSKKVLIFMFIFLFVFVVVNTVMFYVTGLEPSTLITMVFGFCGIEGGCMALIKIKEKAEDEVEAKVKERFKKKKEKRSNKQSSAPITDSTVAYETVPYEGGDVDTDYDYYSGGDIGQ